MKQVLIFDFYVNENNFHSIYNKQHFFCIKYFKKHIDEIQINILSENQSELFLKNIQTCFLDIFRECNFVLKFKFYPYGLNFREEFPLFTEIIKNNGNLVVFMNNFMNFIHENLKETEENILKYICFHYYQLFNENTNLNHSINGTSVANLPIVIGNFDYNNIYSDENKILYIQDNIFSVNAGRYTQHLINTLIENKDIRNIIRYPFYYEYKYRLQPYLFSTEFTLDVLFERVDSNTNKFIENKIIYKNN